MATPKAAMSKFRAKVQKKYEIDIIYLNDLLIKCVNNCLKDTILYSSSQEEQMSSALLGMRSVFGGDVCGLCVLALQLLEVLHLLGFEELVHAAQVLAHLLVAKLVDLGHQTIEEVAVVAHEDERAVIVL